MTEPTKINYDQAKTWAQEVTLERLVKESVKSAIALKSIATETKLSETELKILGAEVKQQTAQNAKDSIQTRANNKEWIGKLNQTTLGLGKGLYGLSSEIKSSLSSANPASLLGGIEAGFGKLGRVVFEVESVFAKLPISLGLVVSAFTLLYEQAFDLVHTFENSYASGIVFSGGLEQMNNIVGESGLSLKDFTSIVDKHNLSFNALGADGIQNVMRAFKGLTRDGSSLMMTLHDATEGVMEYMDIMRISGNLSRLSDMDVAKGAADFYKSVNSVIELSGKSREEITKSTKSALEMPDVNQYLRTLSKDIRENFQKYTLPALAAFGPEITNKMSGAFAAMGVGGTAGLYAFDENLAIAVNALSGVGPAFNQAVQSFKTGKNVEENMLNLDEQLGKHRDFINLQARFGNQWAISARDMLNQLDAAREGIEEHKKKLFEKDEEFSKANHVSIEEATKRRLALEQAEKDRVGDAQKAQSRLSEAMTNLHAKFSNLIVHLIDPVIIPSLNTLSSVLENLTPTIESSLLWFGKAITGMSLDLQDLTSWISGTITTLSPLFTKLSDAIKYVTSWFGNSDKSKPGEGAPQQSDSRTGAHVLEAALGLIFLKKFMGISITKIITTPFSWLIKSLTFSIGKLFTAASGKIIQSLKLPGLMKSLPLPKWAGKALGLSKIPGASALESLEGTAKGLIRGGPGSGIKGLMTNIAEGFAAFGNAKTALGIAVITGSGLGIAAVLGATAIALKQFSGVNWADFEKAGVALAGLGVTIAGISIAISKFAPALEEAGIVVASVGVEFAIGIGAIGLALIPFGGALRLATPAIEAFGGIVGKVFSGMSGIVESAGKSISGIIDSFTKLKTAAISITTDQIERLSKIPGDNMLASANGINAIKLALSDFQPGIVAGISKFFGSFFSKDPAEQLKKLANLGDGLSKTSLSMSAFSKAIVEFNTVKISKDALSTVADLGNLLYTDTGQGFFSSGKITTASKILELAESISKLAGKTSDLRSAAIGQTQTPEQLSVNLTPFQNAASSLSEGIKNAIDGISNNINAYMPLIAHTFAGQTLDTITNLEIFISQIQETIDNSFPGISVSLTKGVDDLTKIINDILPPIDTGFNKFSLDFKESINNINSSIINESVFTQLGRFSEMTGNQQPSGQPEPVRGVVSSGEFQKKTIAFYDNQRVSNASLISLLSQVSTQLDSLDDSINDMSNNVIRSIKDNSGAVYGR